MTIPLNIIYSYFETGDFPTEAQFRATWDSFWHKDMSIPQSSIENFSQTLQSFASSEQFKKHLVDNNAHNDSLAKLDASNVSVQNSENWKAKIETQTSIQPPQLNGNILTIFYTGENGVQQSQSVELDGLATNDISIENAQYDASQNIITITQSDGSAFQINLSEFSIISTINPDGSVSLVQEGVEKVLLKKVAMSGSFNDLTDKPTFTGNDTLEDVIQRGNTSTKAINLDTVNSRGQLWYNAATFSYYFNSKPHIGSGKYNVAIGLESLNSQTTGSYNTAIGTYTGYLLTSGKYNTMVGAYTATALTTANGNTYIGDEVATKNTGFKNVFIGTGSGYNTTVSNGNIVIGYKGSMGVFGDRNILIGLGVSGKDIGGNNVLIGVGAGALDAGLNNKLIIHSNHTISGFTNDTEGVFNTPQHSSLSHALITGDFVDRWAKINGYFVVGTPGSNSNDITINPSAGITAKQQFTPTDSKDYVQKGYVDSKLPYKKYVALIRSDSTTPGFIELENSIGAIVWTKTNVGEYIGTLNGVFTQDKVACFAQCSQGNGGIGFPLNIITDRISSDSIFVKVVKGDESATPFDFSGQVGSLEVRIYN